MGDGLDDALPVDGRVAKGADEERGIFGVALEFGYHAVPIFAHFHGLLHGFEGLIFEAGGAPVPEKGRVPEHVEKRHGIAVGDAADALAKGPRIGEGVGGQVARGAGYGAIGGEDGVGKEPLAKGDALDGQRIVWGNFRRGESRWHGQFVGGWVRRRGRGNARVFAAGD